MKTTKQYESKLKKLIADRTGSAYEPWMDLTVRSAAMCLVTLDKIQEELLKAPLVIMEENSRGAPKTLPNPLVATYKDMQRTMIMYYESLGLTYKNDPTRINTSAKKEDENEGAQAFLNRLNG